VTQQALDFSASQIVRAQDTAEISADEVYRWWLTRELGGERPLVICGLNPSTATATDPDNTIEKEMKFCRSWGFGRLIKVNTEDFRTKSPKILVRARKSGIVTSSPENDNAILRAVDVLLNRDPLVASEGSGIFLAAWGKHADPVRVKRVVELVAGRVPFMCIKTNKDGSPTHPLYQPDASTYRSWVPNV
jgi:hypothetical protein